MKIGRKKIGRNNVFVIAEIGVNHNGSLETAKKMVDAAVKAGADAVKTQTFKAEKIVTASAGKVGYQKETTGQGTQREMLKKLELKNEDLRTLSDYCREKNVIFLSTPFDCESVAELQKLGVPAFKIGSGELTNYFLLEAVAKTGKQVILSTGMSTLREVADSVRFLKKNGSGEIALLHCTSSYPTDLKDVNMQAMLELKKYAKIIGYSDHTLGKTASTCAVCLGASIIEKHFTLDKSMPGPDQRLSANPVEFKDLGDSVRSVQAILGGRTKRPTQDERKTMKLVRKSIVASRDIKKGEKITRSMLRDSRPGTGISPKDAWKVIGKQAKEDIPEGTLILQKMFWQVR